MTLSEAPLGSNFSIHHLGAQPEACQRLRELGFSERTDVRTVVKNSSRIICEVHNTRIGLHTRIADTIHVLPSEAIAS